MMVLFGDMVWVFLGTSVSGSVYGLFPPPRKPRKPGNRSGSFRGQACLKGAVWCGFRGLLGLLGLLTIGFPRGYARGRKPETVFQETG